AALEAESKRHENLLQSATINAQTGIAAELVIAADQFIISPAGRKEEAIRTHAEGDEVRSVIAGYHWFTDWGRDTMISLEGLTMVTGRFLEAAWILKTFASYINKGLIPNLFPEGKTEGLYHTADATLWFFHALNRYLNYTKDINLIDSLLDKMISVIDFHLHGTSFGIRADPEDSLLIQGMEGYQLTWMDAKVEDWVVTPRRGKAVEINALWYNAVAALYNWVSCIRGDKSAQYLGELSQKIKFSFNNKFWNEKRQYLYDVIEGPDGNDDACRPNQLIALSLDFPVLAEKHWLKVLNAATEKLLTPVGLRTLSEDHPDYKSTYSGNLKSRDASYHQGTVWAWLIGPYIDAFLRVFPQKKNEAHKFLYGFNHHLNEACIGSISEIFDAQAPYTPRGCIAQAWSVAEVLRCLIKTYPEHTG
ncbi:MAG: glycogen debranching protein, partial [Fibrobacter sp.]|nr:glycogen debranching protein [Fibrobacter sp.]